jgi:hypothetical protein
VRCRGNHSSYVCPNAVDTPINALSTDIEIYALDFELDAPNVQLNAVDIGRSLKTTSVIISTEKNSSKFKALLDTGAGISCISLTAFQELGGRASVLNRMRIRYANKGIGMAYGPVSVDVSLPVPQTETDKHPISMLVVPDLAYDCILNTDILRQSSAVWIFQDGRDILVTNPGKNYEKLFNILELQQPVCDDAPPTLVELNHFELVDDSLDSLQLDLDQVSFDKSDLIDMSRLDPEIHQCPELPTIVGTGEPTNLWLPLSRGRCIFSLPWRSNSRPASNFRIAVNRDRRLKDNLLRSGYWDQFLVEIAQFEAKGFCHKVKEQDIRYFIPCFPVKKRDSDRLRVVFNARDLNNYLEVDDIMCRSTLPSLLIFRHFPHIRGSDLSMAFLQIVLPEQDTRYCGFIVNDQCYVMSRMLFGLRSSPAGMTQAAASIILRAQEQLKDVSESYGLSVYIDDVLVGASSAETAEKVFDTVIGEFDKCGFEENPSKRIWKYPPLSITERIGLKHYRLNDGSVEHEYNLKRFVA